MTYKKVVEIKDKEIEMLKKIIRSFRRTVLLQGKVLNKQDKIMEMLKDKCGFKHKK